MATTFTKNRELAMYEATDRIRYVSPSGANGYNGLSPGRPQRSIQEAIEQLAPLGGGVVRFSGSELVEDITARDRVSIEAVGSSRTAIKSPSGSTAKGVITMAPGPVTGVYMRGFSVRPNGNVGQHGIYMEATSIEGDPANHGGLWDSGFTDIRVGQFSGDSWWFRGGGTDTLKPHQFIKLDNCFATSSTTGAALRLSGQCGQFRIDGGQFDGPSQGSPSSHPSLVIQREIEDDRFTARSTQGGYTITFTTTTFQSNRLGALIDAAGGVLFMNPYFENLDMGVDIKSAPLGVTLLRPRFANAASKVVSDGLGFAVRARGSRVEIKGGEILGRMDKAWDGDAAAGSFEPKGITYPSSIGNHSTGLTRQSAIATDGSLQVDRVSTHLVNTSTTHLRTLNSHMSVGDQVTLRAYQGPFTINSGGNISLSGNAFPFTVQSGQTITFVRMDLVTSWTMVGYSGGTQKIISDAPPAVIPTFVGQEFLDTANQKKYEASGTTSVADWFALN
jgi:hypothetical protein